MTAQDCMMRKLSEEEILDIYNGVAGRHFPKEELKPVGIIERLLREGGYEGLGLFAGEELLGYALFVKNPQRGVLLLDYYAILESYRNSGMGSVFLQKMRECYQDAEAILLETEEPHLAENEADADLRRRRNAFYIRNGAVQTGVKSRLYAVELGILYIPLLRSLTEKEVMEELDGIYRFILPEEHGKKCLVFSAS